MKKLSLSLLVSCLFVSFASASDVPNASNWRTWTPTKKVAVATVFAAGGYAGAGALKDTSPRVFDWTVKTLAAPAGAAALDALSRDHIGLGSGELSPQAAVARNVLVNTLVVGGAGFLVRTALGVTRETFWGVAKQGAIGVGATYTLAFLVNGGKNPFSSSKK